MRQYLRRDLREKYGRADMNTYRALLGLAIVTVGVLGYWLVAGVVRSDHPRKGGHFP